MEGHWQQLGIPAMTGLDSYRGGCTETGVAAMPVSDGKQKKKTVAAWVYGSNRLSDISVIPAGERLGQRLFALYQVEDVAIQVAEKEQAIALIDQRLAEEANTKL